ncbi:transforming growth factor-beta-induced protein ig-h3-like [Dreissena polymorpha]|uniref:transforming growth factor-beta-induced protein ig-h3-like n=1 Tax=Dreissena polymorpha TaxID=45954 RepID=UPI0022656912|nr:transforming growth factor-beta-induced protein ig-h3-like [Dreissena polymorpha]
MLRNLALMLVVVCGCRALSTVQTLAGDKSFSTLVSLVTQAGLVDTLNGGTFTIFAPNNAAFAALPAATLQAVQNDAALLKSVLLYHVVANRVLRASLNNEHKETSAQGKPIRFNHYNHNHVRTAEGIKILAFDKICDNGVIHTLAGVMMPPEGDIVNIVSNHNETSTLLSLAVAAGIAGALQGDGLTLFAPTNDAFAKIPAATVAQLTGNIPLLTEVLKYHVIPHTEFSVGLWDGQMLRTLDGTSITVHARNGVTLNSGSQVTKADIGATNGVVHYIDTVLIPTRHASIFG